MKTSFIFLALLNLLFANEQKQDKVDLQNIVIETPSQIKTTDKYKEKKNLLIDPINKNESSKTKDDKVSIDGNVDFNKEEKTIDGAKVNIGVKF